jgi:hypothetical protein
MSDLPGAMLAVFEGREISVPAGPGAYERATYEAVRKYGLDIQLDQVGWTNEWVTFLIEEVTE